MKRWLHAAGIWCEARLNLRETLLPLLRHPVPRGVNWWYVFGSATLTMLVVQIVTGVCLAMVYVPSADQAYESLEYLNYQQPLGWFLRAVHFYAASGMVVMMVVHLTQVFLWGAFKYPRELTWLMGVVLFFLTLGMAFTGQVLRWDQDAYWGVGVGAAIAGRIPLIGPQAVDALLGGPIIGGSTLSRFFALHVFILPGLIFLFLGVHLYLVVRRGISEPPVPGKPVDPKTYDAQYRQMLKRGEPFFPQAFSKDGVFAAAIVLLVVALAWWLGPYGPNEPPDPTLIDAEPRPDWPFLPLFAILALCPPALEPVAMFGLPLGIFVALVAVPLVSNRGERSFRRRPVAVISVVLLYLVYGVLLWLGDQAPWSPKMHAWSGDPVPVDLVKARSPLELQGAVVLQNKNCRNCHALEGVGGRRGPDLTHVATRLTRDELVRQVLQGGGNMPAYGQQLSPQEVEALVAFLGTLRPADQPPARSPVPPATWVGHGNDSDRR